MAQKNKVKDTNTVLVDGKKYSVLGVVEKLRRVVTKSFLVKDIYERWTDETMVPDEFLQRMEGQWAKKQNSRLISAMLNNRPIGTIIIATGRTYSNSNVVYSILDGLQRIYAIVSFINNKFKLDKNEKPIECNVRDEEGNCRSVSFDIAGKNFKSLPKAMQNFLLDYAVRIDSYECFTDEELDDIMFCVNNGKTPTVYQKMRFAIGTENMRLIQPICESVTLEEVSGCKAKNDSNLCCVLRGLMIYLNCVDKGLSASAINKFIDDFDENVTSNDLTKYAEIVEEFDDIKMNMTSAERDLLDSCNLPHFVANFAVYNSLKNKNGKTYIEFFREFIKSDEWSEFTQKCEKSGSGGAQYSAETVEDRQYIIDQFLYDFLDCAIPHNGVIITNKSNEECEAIAKTQYKEDGAGNNTGTSKIFEANDFGESSSDNTDMQTNYENSGQTVRIGQSEIGKICDEEELSADKHGNGADDLCDTGHMHVYECVQAG